uniref:Corticotropin-releasing factor domain-containing protein n=1 Tax=Phasianus colchicus TaxID=9054 RepID=A0A669PGR1_PHACC
MSYEGTNAHPHPKVISSVMSYYLCVNSGPAARHRGGGRWSWGQTPSATPTPAAVVKKSSTARKVSLSLDVPTHILRILLDLAREKELQAKAAANAELMARIGRRK